MVPQDSSLAVVQVINATFCSDSYLTHLFGLLVLFALYVQYSPFITSHTRGVLGVVPRDFSRGKGKSYTWD